MKAPGEFNIPLGPFFSAFIGLSLLYKTQLNIQNKKGGNDYG
jgi:hypothetical protein